jgi:O-antigen ligase
LTAIYIIAGLVALVWGAIFLLRGSLVAGCLAYLVMASCFGYEFAHFTIGPVPMTLDRLALAVLLAVYAVQRWLGQTQRTPPEPIDFLLAAFLGVLCASTLWGSIAANPSSLMLRLIGGYLISAIVYWIARQTTVDRGKISLIHGVLAGLGIYLGVTGVLEITGQWWAVFPSHIADPTVGLHFGRARGPMVHAVSFGTYLGVGLLAVWIWQWRLGRVGRLLLMMPVPIMLAALYSSYTRSVWMGTGLGLLLVMAMTLRGVWRPLVVGGMISAAALLTLTRMDNLVSFNRELPASYTGKSVELRGEIAYVSWQMFLDRPLLGFGFDQYPKAKLAYLADRSTDLNLEATRDYVHHNTYLSLLTETGLLGLGLALALLACWGRTAWQIARDSHLPDWARAQGALTLGALGLYACQAAFHELSYLSINNALLFFLAGITTAIHSQAASGSLAEESVKVEEMPSSAMLGASA